MFAWKQENALVRFVISYDHIKCVFDWSFRSRLTRAASHLLLGATCRWQLGCLGLPSDCFGFTLTTLHFGKGQDLQRHQDLKSLKQISKNAMSPITTKTPYLVKHTVAAPTHHITTHILQNACYTQCLLAHFWSMVWKLSWPVMFRNFLDSSLMLLALQRPSLRSQSDLKHKGKRGRLRTHKCKWHHINRKTSSPWTLLSSFLKSNLSPGDL